VIGCELQVTGYEFRVYKEKVGAYRIRPHS